MPEITTVILIKGDAIDTHSLNEYYYKPLEELGIPKTSVAVRKLIYDNPKKVTSKVGKAWLTRLKEELPNTVLNLIIADSNYYKWITKASKVSKNLGISVLGTFEGYEEYRCVHVPNYRSLYKNPENAQLIKVGLEAITGLVKKAVIHSAQYCYRREEDRDLLDQLYQYPALTMDIETAGLKYNDYVATIAFAWDKHNGIAIDLRTVGYWHVKEFLETYSGDLIMHNALFDAKLCISNWWMEHETDYEGLQKGLNVFTKIHDTMLLTYLAKNSTTSIDLGLKTNALEYVGNYALDVTDINRHTPAELLKYNLIDCLGTWFVYEKYSGQLTSEAYTTIFQPSIKPILKMMLVGLPLDKNKVYESYDLLISQEKQIREKLFTNPHVIEFTKRLQEEAMHAANAKLKTKVKPIEDFAELQFNPNSGTQIGKLLFDTLELPILETTAGGSPSTDAKTLAKVVNHTEDQNIIDIIDNILEIAEVTKISGTFLKACMVDDEFLHGNLKLGGTQSGRLSSNSPNLTNLPSKGDMGKLIKSCFVAPKGWLFAGADYSSLEERIGAILSNDPNRIKVYTDGFDGHSMRAQKYFADQMPDIDPNDVESVNSIERKYKELRRKSKQPTFALQYGGTAYTLHKNAGIPMDEATQIENSYHELYKVSDEFAERNKEFAIEHGYMNCAFGLKIATPIIQKSVMNSGKTPYPAVAEVRSANNAVTQSWGMLLNRSVIATNRRIEEAKLHTEILPINMIHDAAYFLVKDNPETVKFLNDVLIEEMEWNEHPLIQSDDVPMLSGLEIGRSWADVTELKNRASIEEITGVLNGL